MTTATLAQLRTRAQSRADMVNDAFVSNSEWLDFINASVAELYDLLVSADEDYFTTTSAFSTVAGTETINLPGDFYKLVGVDLLDAASGLTVTLRPYNVRERNSYRNATWAPQSVPRYWLRAGKLSLLPVPTDVRTGTLYYVPVATKLAGDTDTFDGINGWEEYVVADCAAKAVAKQEQDPTPFLQAKNELAARIKAMAQQRDPGAPHTISDVYADGCDGDWP
jgi:hypothetical protein